MKIRYSNRAFTIVELLVVIVVIGILASITIVSYTGISQRAIAAAIQSDLNNASKKLKLYQVDNGNYPASIDCSASPAANTICIKASTNNVLAYAPNNNSGTSGFNLSAMNLNNGATYSVTDNSPIKSFTSILTALGTPTIATGAFPNDVAVSFDGTSVYVTNYNANSVSMYSRDTSTGALTALGTPTIAAGTRPWDIDISADGTSVYVSNYSTNNVSMYSRNASTGALTALGNPTIATGPWPIGIVISADGASMYIANYSSANISMYKRNISTGALTALTTPTIAAGTGPTGIAISANGNSIYTANHGSSNVSMFNRN